MATAVHVVNRYKSDDYVVGAAVTFDAAAIDAKTPRTRANGMVYVDTQGLADGDHVMHVTPPYTSPKEVGPDVAEDQPNSVTRMYRSLDATVTIKNGRIQAVSAVAGQQDRGSVGSGVNPVRFLLQPIYFRGIYQKPKARKYEEITSIVLHQTAGSTNVEGTLSVMKGEEKGRVGSAHYILSAEARPQVIKIVQDNGIAGHVAPAANQSWWAGKNDVAGFSIGIEMSHQAGTPWPKAQVERLIKFLEQLLKAYPSIKRHRIVGHSDVLLFGHDCPGLEFDWAMLEKEGLGMVPKAGAFSAEKAYGGFFNLQPQGTLRAGDDDKNRVWGGGKAWPPVPTGAPIAGAALTVTGNPIKELQTDLSDIGYFVPADGQFGPKTQWAIQMFQRHFFAGSRRGVLTDAQRKKPEVDRVTAEFIKSVRP